MIIDVILGGETYYENGVPCVRGGRLTKADRDNFRKEIVVTENDDERTEATEYWLREQLVHRSVHVILKKPLTEGGYIDQPPKNNAIQSGYGTFQ